jgi:hypothetical protein
MRWAGHVGKMMDAYTVVLGELVRKRQLGIFGSKRLKWNLKKEKRPQIVMIWLRTGRGGWPF